MRRMSFYVYFSFRKKVEIKLTVVSGIRQVKLLLLGGECEVNCDGSKNNCTVYTQSKTIRDVSFFHVTIELTLSSNLEGI
jgi:hypothetical protein